MHIWRPGAEPPLFPAVSLDGPSALDALGPVLREQVGAYLAAVLAARGRLPDGWEPSPDKVAAWPQLHASLGPTYLPPKLPYGHIWVEAHERGSDPNWRSGAVRTRDQASPGDAGTDLLNPGHKPRRAALTHNDSG
jgi:hypothetical protein